MTSAPAASRRSASLGVNPRPSAVFSPLTTQKSAPSSSRSPGSRSSIARRPAEPKTSARKRRRNEAELLAQRDGAGRVEHELDVVPGVPGVPGEREVLGLGKVDDAADARCAGGD